MKNNQYTPLPLSKIISERLPELETEDAHNYCGGHTWYDDNGEGKWKPCAETLPVIQDDHYCESAGLTCEKVYPARTFTDCLRAIEMLGEKEGWEKMQHFTRMLAYGEGEEYWFGTDNKEPEPMWKAEAFWLFENYLSDHYTIGENTIAYLTELFTKK